MKKLLVLVFCQFLIFSCAGKKKEDSAEYAYTEAMNKLKQKRYSEAAESFEKIDDDYPLSRWSIKAQVIAAYCYYKDEKYDETIKVVEDFIRLNPANSDIAYMQYLRSMSYYNRIVEITKAQDDAQMASYNFRELIARFPGSDYAIDAKERLNLVEDHIAGAKMSIGRYQMKMANYVGAVQSFKEVIDRHFATNQAPEAYLRLFEIYYKIGLKKQSEEMKAELEKSYPESKWYTYAKEVKIN